MKAIFALVVFFSITSLVLLPARDRVVPTNSNRTSKPERPRGVGVFSENHSLRLHGKLHTGANVDVSTIGVGPIFIVNTPTKSEGGGLVCQYSVTERDGVYSISYTVGVRVRIETSRMNGNINYEYRDYTLEGNTICEIGSSVAIFKNGEESLNLSLVKSTDSQ